MTSEEFWTKAAQAPAWYVVEAKHGKEFDLALALSLSFAAAGPASDGVEVLHLVDEQPVARRVRVNGERKVATVRRKVSRFGPLVFVRVALTKSLLGSIDRFPLAHGVLRCKDGARPVTVGDDMIAFYKASDPFARRAAIVAYAPGDRVRIVNGPATGVEAVVDRVDNGRALRLYAPAFGRAGPILIEAAHVELVAHGGWPAIKQGERGRRDNRRRAAHAAS